MTRSKWGDGLRRSYIRHAERPDFTDWATILLSGARLRQQPRTAAYSISYFLTKEPQRNLINRGAFSTLRTRNGGILTGPSLELRDVRENSNQLAVLYVGFIRESHAGSCVSDDLLSVTR